MKKKSCWKLYKEIERTNYNNSEKLEEYIDDCMYLMGGAEGIPPKISELVKNKTSINLMRISLLNKGFSKPLAVSKYYNFQKQEKLIEIIIYHNPGSDPHTYKLSAQCYNFENTAFDNKLFSILKNI